MALQAHQACGSPTESPRRIAAPASAICIGLLLAVSGYAAEKGSDKRPVLEARLGDATIYASYFEGRRTASGRIFKVDESVAAHRTYPFGTLVRVTYLRNKRSVNVVIVDRGPYGKNHKEGAIIDLSPSAAKNLGMVRAGQARVRVEVLEWGKGGHRN